MPATGTAVIEHGGDRRSEREGARNASPAPRQSYADQVANGASLSNVAFLAAPAPARAMQLSATMAARPSPGGRAREVGREAAKETARAAAKRYSSQGGGYRAR